MNAFIWFFEGKSSYSLLWAIERFVKSYQLAEMREICINYCCVALNSLCKDAYFFALSGALIEKVSGCEGSARRLMGLRHVSFFAALGVQMKPAPSALTGNLQKCALDQFYGALLQMRSNIGEFQLCVLF